MVMPSHPLSRDELVSTLTSVNSLTTTVGAAGGLSLIDSTLIGAGAASVLGKTILILSGTAAGQRAIATAFNNATGEITPNKAFSAQILAGVIYRLLNLAINSGLSVLDYWSALREEIAVTGAQSTIALPTITIADLPGGAAIVIAKLMFFFRAVENTFAGVNKLDAAVALPMQVDDAAGTGYVTGIDFVDDAFGFTIASREGGTVVIGDHNIAARVDGNDVYSVRWLNVKADQANLQFNDCQVGLRIFYSM